MSQFGTHGFNRRLRQISIIIFRREHHYVNMRVVAFIVKRSIPAQVLTINLHVFAEHRPLGTQKLPPLLSRVISQTGCILPPQADHVCPYRSLMMFHILLHLGNHHWSPNICKKSVFSHTFYTRTVRQIVHIVLPVRELILVPFQHSGNKFRRSSNCWMYFKIFIL